jgi:hypothetical protein
MSYPITESNNMTISHEGDNVLIDGEVAVIITSDTVYDEWRGEWRTRHFPEIDGDRIGRDSGYRTREAAAAKIKARVSYLRRQAVSA